MGFFKSSKNKDRSTKSKKQPGVNKSQPPIRQEEAPKPKPPVVPKPKLLDLSELSVVPSLTTSTEGDDFDGGMELVLGNVLQSEEIVTPPPKPNGKLLYQQPIMDAISFSDDEDEGDDTDDDTYGDTYPDNNQGRMPMPSRQQTDEPHQPVPVTPRTMDIFKKPSAGTSNAVVISPLEDPGSLSRARSSRQEQSSRSRSTRQQDLPQMVTPPSANTSTSRTPFDERADRMQPHSDADDEMAEYASAIHTTHNLARDNEMNMATRRQKKEELSPSQVSRRLLSTFACNADSACANEELFKRVAPILPNACTPDFRDLEVTEQRQDEEEMSQIFVRQFAVKFLDEILNDGLHLIYHHQPDLGPDVDWVGRSVTMALRPGVVTALQMEQPHLEWSSMGGGRSSEVLSKSIGLLDVHSITTSVADASNEGILENDDGSEDDEEPMCFCTITTLHGDVHMFETITPEQTERMVSGLKNIIARYSSLVLSRDLSVLSEFYNGNTVESAGSKLRPEMALLHVCHAFMDE